MTANERGRLLLLAYEQVTTEYDNDHPDADYEYDLMRARTVIDFDNDWTH